MCFFQNKTKQNIKMEAVITYTKGYPKKTNLTYRNIKDDVVERIVSEHESIIEEQKEQKEQKNKKIKRKLVVYE